MYLSYDGLTDPLGQSQVLPYLKGLSKKGHQITVLSAEKKENFSKRETLIKRIIRENGLRWEYIFYTKKPPVLSTLWDLYRLGKKSRQLHRESRFSIVHCRSYITALLGLSMKKRWKVKFIFDMRGFWADERVEGGLWNLKNLLFRWVYLYFKRKEREFLQKADYVVSLTHAAKTEMLKWKLTPMAPVEVIPCCVELELFHLPALKKERTAVNFTLSYLGSTGTWYLLDEMLLFYKRLLLVKPFARFLFITPDEPASILQRASALQVPAQKIQIVKAERNEVPKLLSESDISVFFIKPSFSKKASSATKMGEILAMGIPVISNAKVGDNDRLFAKYTCGYLLNELTVDAFDKVIFQLDELLDIPPQDLCASAESYFSLENGISLYDKIYHNLSSL